MEQKFSMLFYALRIVPTLAVFWLGALWLGERRISYVTCRPRDRQTKRTS